MDRVLQLNCASYRQSNCTRRNERFMRHEFLLRVWGPLSRPKLWIFAVNLFFVRGLHCEEGLVREVGVDKCSPKKKKQHAATVNYRYRTVHPIPPFISPCVSKPPLFYICLQIFSSISSFVLLPFFHSFASCLHIF